MSDNTVNRKIITYLLSVAIAVGLYIAFAALFAAAVYFLNIDRKYLPFMSTLSAAAGCFSASFFASKKINDKGYLTGLITGGICFFIIVLISFIAGSDGITMNTLFHFVIILLAGIIGGITGVNSGFGRII